MCRLPGCRKPCNLTVDPPSKYCSAEHKQKFWQDTIARAPDGPEPSRGGALTKPELKALLENKKGDVKAFHALGQKPTLQTPEEEVDWSKILTPEEKGRLCTIAEEKIKLKERSQGYKDKERVVRMAMDRLKKATDGKKELAGVCGWDERLAMNEEEFDIWRKSQAGIEAFKTGTLDGTFCDRKRCTRHAMWVKLGIQDARYEDIQVIKAINKLRAEEHRIKDVANTRAASQL
jgi:COMPASS component SPP1